MTAPATGVDDPLRTLDAGALRAVIVTFRDALEAHQEAINRLNVYPVPDGDTGTNMGRTLDAVVDELATADDDLAAVCQAMSHGSLMGARGNSGVILSQILRGFAGVVRGADEITGGVVASAFGAASDAAYRAVLTPVEGTILTVARDVAAAALEGASSGDELADVLRAARSAGRESLARTPELLPVLRDAGVVDAGAAGFLLLLDAALAVVAGEPIPDAPHADVPASATRARPPTAAPVSGEMRYEVMFLLDLADDRIGDLEGRWGSIGDSVVVVGGEGTWNCHVHTNDIGGAIEAALDLDGRPSRIRVTDLFDEVADQHACRDAEMTAALEDVASREVSRGAASARTPPARTAPAAPPVPCAVVAVASGPGLASVFGARGAQEVVSGGQTLNPSTAELLAAVDAAPSDEVVVLPNNRNIISVAEQIDALTPKTVVVVPTRSMPEGLAALGRYDPHRTARRNATAMSGAAASVITGEVTTAVRDARSDAGAVRAGDWIGLAGGDGIAAAGSSVVDVATELLARLVSDTTERLTIVTGLDARDGDIDAIVSWLGRSLPMLDVAVLDGGQPLYPYLFGVE